MDTLAPSSTSLISVDAAFLEELSSILRTVLKENSNSDLASQKSWLLESFGELEVRPEAKLRFLDYLTDVPGLLGQTLMQIAMSRPKALGRVLSTQGLVLRDFFSRHPEKVPAWFQFRFSEENQHGALALERYLFEYRDTAWECLSWRGKRGHPPVVVVQKKNLLMEIDVESTMKRLLLDEKFWTCSFLEEVLEQGSFLQLDYSYFLGHLERCYREDKASHPARQLRKTLKQFFQEEPLKALSARLLPLFKDSDLLSFIYRFAEPQPTPLNCLLNGVRWKSLTDVCFIHTLLVKSKVVVQVFKAIEKPLPLPSVLTYLQGLPNESIETRLCHLGLIHFLVTLEFSEKATDEDRLEELIRKLDLPLEPVRQTLDTKKSSKKHKSKRKRLEITSGWKFAGVLHSVDELPPIVAQHLLASLSSQCCDPKRDKR